MPARSRCCVSREGAPLRATRQPFPLAFGCLKKLLFRVFFLNHPSVKHACGAPKTVRPWRNKPINLIFAPKPPRATPIRLASPKLEAFAVDNTAKPAFREALVSFILVACREMIRHHLRGRAEEAWCFVSNACFSSVLSYLSRTPLMLLSAPVSSSLPIVLPVSRVSSARSIGVVIFGDRSSAAPGWFLLLLLLENEEQPEGSCCLIFVSSKRPLRKPKSNSHSEHPA